MGNTTIITTSNLIHDLRLWVQELKQMTNEAQLHAKILEKLKKMNLSLIDKGKIKNPEANGVSRPDVRVTSVEPQLLIEIKANGGWMSGSHAAWQLFQSAKLLQAEGIITRKLAIFGTKITDPILFQMLEALDIQWECVGLEKS